LSIHALVAKIQPDKLVRWCADGDFLTGSIARSAKRRLFKLLRGRFWGFLPHKGDKLHQWGEISHQI